MADIEKVVKKSEHITLEEENANDADKFAASIVPQTDDPTAPAFTFRVLILGTFWCIFLASANLILSFRTNTFDMDSMLAVLLSYPVAVLMAKTLPTRIFNVFGWRFSLNPGPFSIKEHVLIGIIASAGASGAYGVDNVIVQRDKQYMGNTNISFMESLAWILATQFIGFGIAGLTRRILVKPKAMYWPGILGSVAFYTTLHKPDTPVGRWTMSRSKFFWISFITIFVYTWIPQYFFNTIQAVAILCLFSKNRTVNFLGSGYYYEGFGIGMLTFDWYYVGPALLVPCVYYLNNAGGNILYNWIIVPILYYTNAFKSPVFQSAGTYPGTDDVLPSINHARLFNRFGNAFKAKELMNPLTYDLNIEKYDAFKPIYISELFAMTYMGNFLVIGASFVHVALWHGKEIVNQVKDAIKQTKNSETDIHNHLMSAYADVPDWVYGIFLAACIAFMSVVVSTTHFHLPIWAVGISALAIIPIGVIQAITGTRVAINVLSQMVIGLLLPGKTINVMAYKSLGTNSMLQAGTLISDLKLGHYMKIPPISMVLSQLYGTLVGSCCVAIASFFVMDHMQDILGHGEWAGTSYMIFYNAGGIWGAIGPARFFGIGSPYESLLYGFLVGAILPILPWLGHRYYPAKFWKYINIPTIVYSATVAAVQSTIVVPLMLNIFFQFYLFRYKHDWWSKYNYVFAAAISGAVGVAVLTISVLTNIFNVQPPYWAGNVDLATASLDYYCIEGNSYQ